MYFISVDSNKFVAKDFGIPVLVIMDSKVNRTLKSKYYSEPNIGGQIMGKYLKKAIAVSLSALLVFCNNICTTTIIKAAEISPKLITVISNNAALRTSASKSGEKIAETYCNRVLVVVNESYNEYGNRWYEVSWEKSPGDGTTAFIYSENVEDHNHAYMCKEVDGIQFSYCNCGDISIEETAYIELSKADTLVLGATATAGATALADGPFPVGDIIGAVLVAGVWGLAYSGSIPSELQAVTTDVDFMEYIKDNGEVCSNENFRMVKRVDGILQVIGDKCLNIPQAYIYSRYCKGDVWTSEMLVAQTCAELNGEYFGPEVDKAEPGYYYHFHYGSDHKHCVGGHIFYDKGQFTGCVPNGL